MMTKKNSPCLLFKEPEQECAQEAPKGLAGGRAAPQNAREGASAPPEARGALRR